MGCGPSKQQETMTSVGPQAKDNDNEQDTNDQNELKGTTTETELADTTSSNRSGKQTTSKMNRTINSAFGEEVEEEDGITENAPSPCSNKNGANNSSAATMGITGIMKKNSSNMNNTYTSENNNDNDDYRGNLALTGPSRNVGVSFAIGDFEPKQLATGGSRSSGGGLTKKDRRQTASKDVDFVITINVQRVMSHWDTIRELGEVGSPSDDDLEKLDNAKSELIRIKQRLVATLQEKKDYGTEEIKILSDEVRDRTYQFLDRILEEGDGVEGNIEVLDFFLDSMAEMNYAMVCSERDWLTTAVADGSVKFMKMLLDIPGVSMTCCDAEHIVELLAGCCFNQTCRVTLMARLLDCDKVFGFLNPEEEEHEDLRTELGEMLRDFFVDVASRKNEIPREDRTHEYAVLNRLIKHPNCAVDCDEEEGPDGQTVFSRAAAEGEAQTLMLLLDNEKVKNINRAQSDKTTALIQAVFNNHYPVVAYLTSLKGPEWGGPIDLNYKCGEGSALEIAVTLQRDPKIVALLKALGAQN